MDSEIADWFDHITARIDDLIAATARHRVAVDTLGRKIKRLAPPRHVRVAPLNRPAAVAAVTAIQSKIGIAFDEIRPGAVATVRQHLGGGGDDHDDEEPAEQAARVANHVDLAPLILTGLAIGSVLTTLAQDSGSMTLDQVGTDDSEISDQIRQAAADLARARSAEMVGKRWDGDTLVDNPDARFAITDSTRAMIADTISEGIRRGASVDQIGADVAQSAALSTTRANLIARTEIAGISGTVALAALRSVRNVAGVKVRKTWLVDGNPCPVCAGNEGEVIDLDDVFASGHGAPTVHPGCECELAAVISNDDE